MENYTVSVNDMDLQLLSLSLALTAIQRPGWDYACGQLADKLGVREIYETCKEANR